MLTVMVFTQGVSSMFNFFGSFKKKQPEPQIEPNLIEITFCVNPEGQIEHEILWSENTEAFVNTIGKLLHTIHNGDFTNESVAILKHYIEQSPEHQGFVACVLNKWVEIKKAETAKEDEDKPLISPEMFISSKDNDEDEE